MSKEETSIQTGIRLPESLLDRIDKIAETLSSPGVEVTRSDVHRKALFLGVEQLESARKPKKTRG